MINRPIQARTKKPSIAEKAGNSRGDLALHEAFQASLYGSSFCRDSSLRNRVRMYAPDSVASVVRCSFRKRVCTVESYEIGLCNGAAVHQPVRPLLEQEHLLLTTRSYRLDEPSAEG